MPALMCSERCRLSLPQKPARANGNNECAMVESEEDKAPVILIVDDMTENIALLRTFLEGKGYEARAATGGRQAMEAVMQEPPDLVLLDLVMPGMDGYEVCERLKRDKATHHIPVVVVTGVDEVDANVKALEAGADDFLAKPFNMAVLDARIRNSLKTKKLQDHVMRYNQSLENSIRERTAQLERTQQVAVFSLAKLTESRDPETGDHLDRMRCYAREIALELQSRSSFSDSVNDRFVAEIYLSSPLHDIGKVGIPDQILLKPGKLTPEEFEIMKSHCQIGGDTLRAADAEAGHNSFLAMGRDIAYYHHEKWDGSGYPKGLTGDDIPLEARIVALADVFDALTSKRPSWNTL